MSEIREFLNRVKKESYTVEEWDDALRIQQNVERNIKKTADALRKCIEEREGRKMNIELTENQLSMIIDSLLAYSESIYNYLHALNAMKGTRFEFDDIEEEVAEVQKNLADIREFRAHLVDIYNRKEEEG